MFLHYTKACSYLYVQQMAWGSVLVPETGYDPGIHAGPETDCDPGMCEWPKSDYYGTHEGLATNGVLHEMKSV